MKRKEELIKLIKEKRNKLEFNNELKEQTTWDYVYWSYVYENEEIQKEIVPLEQELYKIIEQEVKELCPSYINLMEHNQKKLLVIGERYKETIKGLEKFKPSGYKQKIELLKEVMGVKTLMTVTYK
jgi:hypothetical protein